MTLFFSRTGQNRLILFSIQLIMTGMVLFFTVVILSHLSQWQDWFYVVFIQSNIINLITTDIFIFSLVILYSLAMLCIIISYIKTEFLGKQLPIFILYSIIACLFTLNIWLIGELLAQHNAAIYDTLFYYILFNLILVFIESNYSRFSKKKKYWLSIYIASKYISIFLFPIIFLLFFIIDKWQHFDTWYITISLYVSQSILVNYIMLIAYSSLILLSLAVLCFFVGLCKGEFLYSRQKNLFFLGLSILIIYISLFYFTGKVLELREDFDVMSSYLARIDNEYNKGYATYFLLQHMLMFLAASISALLLVKTKKIRLV